jgi:hypothetical protein
MRSYIRFDPQKIEEMLKAGYTLAQVGAYYMLQSQAEQQPERGRFKSMGVLKAAMDCAEEVGGPKARASQHVPFLLERGDVVVLDDGSYYANDWDELQEGDIAPKERMDALRGRRGRPGDPESPGARRQRRYRSRQAPDEATPVTPIVTSQSEGNCSVTKTPSDMSLSDVSDVSSDASLRAYAGRKHKAIAIAEGTSDGDASPSGDGDAVTGAVQAPKKPTGPSMSPEAVELVQGYQELGYTQPSATDCLKAEEFVAELRCLTVAEMLDRMRDMLAWCERERKPRPGSLGGFWNSLRQENDHRRDNGARPRDHSAESRTGGLGRIDASTVFQVRQGGLP